MRTRPGQAILPSCFVDGWCTIRGTVQWSCCIFRFVRQFGDGMVWMDFLLFLGAYRESINDETNCGPRSDITLRGVPWSLNMWSLKMVVTPFVVMSVDIRNNLTIFENLLTSVRIASFPCDSGNGSMMSTEMIFQGFWGIVLGWSGVLTALVFDLVFWHLSHPSMYLSMSFWMVGQ